MTMPFLVVCLSVPVWVAAPLAFGLLLTVLNFLDYERTGVLDHRLVKPMLDAGRPLLRVLTTTETLETMVQVVSCKAPYFCCASTVFLSKTVPFHTVCLVR
eukprot:SAG22_NODE_1331_length_4702_cov_2.662177_6_plen_101_part_00